ncbi:Protein of unknown function DUF4246 [Ceraceosorus bombacis]|uniref:Uncharacterized protein n=1 Tax=Ceraceosorus bombacis TaxID=401625 RepID=A0A0P1BIG3_9BASI|nr:Protein of unknown function DUF4246 [Ceraceosorus bombacis]
MLCDQLSPQDARDCIDKIASRLSQKAAEWVSDKLAPVEERQVTNPDSGLSARFKRDVDTTVPKVVLDIDGRIALSRAWHVEQQRFLLTLDNQLRGKAYTEYVELCLAFRQRTLEEVKSYTWCKAWLKEQSFAKNAADAAASLVYKAFCAFDPDYTTMQGVEMSATDPFCGGLRTADELTMLATVGGILEKPGWSQKVFETKITDKWRQEMAADDYSGRMIDYVIAHVQWLAKVAQRGKPEAAGVPAVWRLEQPGGSDLRTELCIQVQHLIESGDERKERDWHPGSNDQVLDIIHPSLFPLVDQRSYVKATKLERETPGALEMLKRAATLFETGRDGVDQLSPLRDLAEIGKDDGELIVADLTLPVTKPKNVWHHEGEQNYQWLPAEVLITSVRDHQTAKILSYINNLHPQRHASVYATLEKAVAAFVPLFEAVVASLLRNSCDRLDGRWACDAFLPGVLQPEREDFWEPKTIEAMLELEAKQNGTTPPSGPAEPSSHDDEAWAQNQERRLRWKKTRKFVRPEVATWKEPIPDVPVSLAGRTLQIIFKIASVELTPDKPKYEGGSWHLEGTPREKICGTGIYYLENENVTTPTLEFRQYAGPDDVCHYQQDLYDHLEAVYGFDNETSGQNQHLGCISTSEGRGICFPNCWQHRLSPFELSDKTKRGHRRFLVMFLVDPFERVPSTAEVRPQQLDWLLDSLGEHKDTHMAALPVEVQTQIFREIDSACEANEWLPLDRNADRFEERKAYCLRQAPQESLDDDSEGERFRPPRPCNLPMTRSEAMQHRLALMAQRSARAEEQDYEYENTWSLCEH